MMMELNIPPIDIQQQHHLLRFIVGLKSKPVEINHFVSGLFQRNLKNAIGVYGAHNRDAKSNTRPYVNRPVVLEYRELLGYWKSNHLTQINNNKWTDTADKKQLKMHALHKGLSELCYNYERDPTTGVSAVKLLPSERNIVIKKIAADKQQQQLEQERKVTLVQHVTRPTKKRSRQVTAPVAINNQLTLNKAGALSESHQLPPTAYLREEMYMKVDDPLTSRFRAQLRIDVAPVKATAAKHCISLDQQKLIQFKDVMCSKCNLALETREHLLMHCISTQITRETLCAKLAVGDNPIASHPPELEN